MLSHLLIQKNSQQSWPPFSRGRNFFVHQSNSNTMKKIRYSKACVRSVLIKTTVVMKIWLFMLIPLGVVMAETANSQTLSLELKNVTLREAFQVIEKESEFSFFFN